MKPLSERQALMAAMTASGIALLGTFGFAWAMRVAPSLSQRPSIPTSVQAATPAVSQAPTGDPAQGRHLFLMNCAHCHGDDAHGDEGPDLYDLHKSDTHIYQVITGGIKGEMPSFAKKLGDPEIHALTAYLRTLRS
jgi:mono/diheme cytochrome c family protein